MMTRGVSPPSALDPRRLSVTENVVVPTGWVPVGAGSWLRAAMSIGRTMWRASVLLGFDQTAEYRTVWDTRCISAMRPGLVLHTESRRQGCRFPEPAVDLELAVG